MTLIYVSLFGVAGVLSRYFIDQLLADKSLFPIATFTINGLGSFLIGVVFVLGMQRGLISKELSLGLMVGFLGGFTTFSAFSLQTIHLMQNSQYAMALAYFVGSPCLGVICACLGIWTGEHFISTLSP